MNPFRVICSNFYAKLFFFFTKRKKKKKTSPVHAIRQNGAVSCVQSFGERFRNIYYRIIYFPTRTKERDNHIVFKNPQNCCVKSGEERKYAASPVPKFESKSFLFVSFVAMLLFSLSDSVERTF